MLRPGASVWRSETRECKRQESMKSLKTNWSFVFFLIEGKLERDIDKDRKRSKASQGLAES